MSSNTAFIRVGVTLGAGQEWGGLRVSVMSAVVRDKAGGVPWVRLALGGQPSLGGEVSLFWIGDGEWGGDFLFLLAVFLLFLVLLDCGFSGALVETPRLVVIL